MHRTLVDRPARASLKAAAALGFAALFACSPAGPEPASQAVPAIPLLDLVRNIEQLRGETVRVCGGQWTGTRRTAEGRVLGWMYSIDGAAPERVQVSLQIAAACGTKRPRRERDCITGRIAQHDGSLTPTDLVPISSHGIADYGWWLHPQCMTSRR